MQPGYPQRAQGQSEVSEMAPRNERRRADLDDNEGFTERVLLSMVFDVTQLADNVERLKVQVFALARERGIEASRSDR